jgi:hypothetical protein
VVHLGVAARHITQDSSGRVRIVDWEAAQKLDSSFDDRPVNAVNREKLAVARLLYLGTLQNRSDDKREKAQVDPDY